MSINNSRTYLVDGGLESLCLNCATVVSKNHKVTLCGSTKCDIPCERCLPNPPRNRKPFKVVRVCDHTAKNNRLGPNYVLEIYPNGVLYIREARRRERVELTVGVIYERAVWAAAMKALREKQSRRKKSRARR